tara:strand:- start:1024 stop:1782 length:759 start_codon:yes stop_codon:yes gene_type:complete
MLKTPIYYYIMPLRFLKCLYTLFSFQENNEGNNEGNNVESEGNNTESKENIKDILGNTDSQRVYQADTSVKLVTCTKNTLKKPLKYTTSPTTLVKYSHPLDSIDSIIIKRIYNNPYIHYANYTNYILEIYHELINNSTINLIKINQSTEYKKTHLYDEFYINYFGNTLILFKHYSMRKPLEGWLHNCFYCEKITGNYEKIYPEVFKELKLNINICSNCFLRIKKTPKLMRQLNHDFLHAIKCIKTERLILKY